MSYWSKLFVLVLIASALAACAGQSAGPAPTPTMELPAEDELAAPLEQALVFLPAGHKPTLFFTDWMRIKRGNGARQVTSQSPWRERSLLFRAAARYSPIAFLGVDSPQQQADIWGWDFSDIDWEAMIALDEYRLPGTAEAGSHIAHVVDLRDDMDVAQIQARLVEYGFARQSYGGFDIYSHEPDSPQTWAGMSRPVMLNVAFVPGVLPPGDTTLIFSEHLPVVQTVLDTLSHKEPSFADATEIDPLLTGLSTPYTAVIASGTACKDWNPLLNAQGNSLSRLSKDQQAEVKRLLGDESPLHPYVGFGMGFYAIANKSFNLMAINYASASDAAADLPTRQQIIAEGFGLTGDPYSMDASLGSAIRDDTALVFVLDPPDQSAGEATDRLINLFSRNDMLFAACP